MAAKSRSSRLRAYLRWRIRDRIADLELGHAEAAAQLKLTSAQWSRLKEDEDIFSLDRLINAGEKIGLDIRMTATRPYQRG